VTQRGESEDEVSCPSVLLVSDDAEFARSVVARWQVERHIPEITLATSDVWFVSQGHSSILTTLCTPPNTPAICVTEDENDIAVLRSEHPRLLVIARHEGWANMLILLASETLRRVEALGRAHRAERMAIESQNHATLGRYVLAMRPNINNALTSVLGNADLLLLEPAHTIKETRDQIQTIHAMVLRLNEIMQRFSSLDTEMRAGEKLSQN
jgi:signal transduction histidine kinase